MKVQKNQYEIEAVQLRMDNRNSVIKFVSDNIDREHGHECSMAWSDHSCSISFPNPNANKCDCISVTVFLGDFIIKDIDGKLYPVSPELMASGFTCL